MSTILPEAMRNNNRWTKDKDGGYWPDENGRIYAPVSAKDDNIGRMDEERVMTLAASRGCGACGLKINEDQEAVFFVTQTEVDEILFREPPMHVPCAGYAARACPHINEAGNYMMLITKAWEPNFIDEEEHGTQSFPFNKAHFFIKNEQPRKKMKYAEFIAFTTPKRSHA